MRTRQTFRREGSGGTTSQQLNIFMMGILAALALFIGCYFILLMPEVPEEDNWYVEMDGKLDSPRRINMTELEGMPAVVQNVSLRGTGEDNEPHLYRGVSLWMLLNASGVHNDSDTVTVAATDGYAYSIDMATIRESHESGDGVIMLAYEKDGKSLKKSTGGPLRLIIPKRYVGEYNAQYCVKFAYMVEAK